MEVKMNKEIRNYQESMFMGLNLRQCIFSLLAIAVAVGIYFGLGKYVGQEMTGWLCILGADNGSQKKRVGALTINQIAKRRPFYAILIYPLPLQQH